MTTRNPALQRLMKFVESKGKPAIIAARLNLSSNVFSNMINRDTKPSADVLMALSSEFPDMDLHYILTGAELSAYSTLKEEFKKRERDLSKELDRHKAVVDRFLLPGKTEGATLCPDSESSVREHQFKQAIKSVRNPRTKKSDSGCVQGTMIPNVMNEVYDILR